MGKETTVKIQSVCEEGVPPTTEHLKFVEQIADSFKLPKNPIKKDYKDAEKLIKQAYEKAQANSFSLSPKEPEVVNDACFVPLSSNKVQEEVKESIIELVGTEILKQQRDILQQYLNDKKLQVFLENPANKALIE
ncbi:MAG: hypothetical protein O7C58_03065 [Rickettsia endosymbiont of Ixodes persulcatus]|nr:hypothetical protein [Rickettsia endosymbiont of Ixodes persulcatus]MCZ6910240.1 hypothetical protein [Rickettsia endosymbiont of Ixodes persulcatus]MCZ6925191.1 hypothetical protein [Rickettsia endosymbiont of Ixodes persulcatus]